MTKTRSLIVATLATLLLTAGLAQAAGRTAQIKAQLATELNSRGLVPPNAVVAPYTAKDLRIRTRVTSQHGIVGTQERAVKWSVPTTQTRLGVLAGTASAQTVMVANPITNVTGVVVTNNPWRQPRPNE